MRAVKVLCGFCNGAGFVPLATEYTATLTKLKVMGESTGAELGRAMGVKPTAMNNRLVGLERHGLVTSRRFGRKRLFTAKGK